MGGATECSMDSTIYEVNEVDPEWKSIPYGEPMWNQLAYVLDEDLQLLPVGVRRAVPRRHRRRPRLLQPPELTAERFVDDPVLRPEDAGT